MISRRAAACSILSITALSIPIACGADPAPAPVIDVEPATAPPPPPALRTEQPPEPRAEGPEEPEAPPGDGATHEFSFSGSVSVGIGDGGVDVSLRSGDASVSFRGTFESDGGVFTFGTREDGGAATPPSPGKRGGRADAGSSGR